MQLQSYVERSTGQISAPSTTLFMPRYGGGKRGLPILGFPGLPIYHDRGGPIRQDFSKPCMQRTSVFLPTSPRPSSYYGTTGGVLTCFDIRRRVDQPIQATSPSPRKPRSYTTSSDSDWTERTRNRFPKMQSLGEVGRNERLSAGAKLPLEILEIPRLMAGRARM